MALQGTLDSFSLPDVLRLLATTGQTGCLHVDGDRGRGGVWLQNGTVVAAAADRALDDAPIDEVVFEMLRFNAGSFTFATDEQSPDGEEPSDVEGVLARAGSMLDEWRELEAVVPSVDYRVRLARTLTVDKVTLDASRWQALAAIGGGRSVGELGDVLNLGELAVIRMVSDLVELGVVTVERPEPSRLSSLSRRSRSDASDGLDSSARSSMDERHRIPSSPQEADATAPRRARRAPGGRSEAPTPNRVPISGDVSSDIEDTNGRSSGDRSSGEGPALPRRSRTTGQRSGSEGGTKPRWRRADGDSSPTPSPPPSPPFGENVPMRAPLLPPSLDTPPPGVSALPDDTGQVPVVPAPSLPSDLSWAAEDDEPPLGPPRMTSPPVGTPPVGQAPPVMPPAPDRRVPALVTRGAGMATAQHPHVEGDTAAHVAVMSPDARAAVEATVGPSGGETGFVAPRHRGSPEEARQRGALMGFLSSLRR